MASAGSILGNAVQRLEDPTLLTGDGKYVDDLVETGMLYVAFVRSAVAHGTIESVDVSEAESMPGVVGVYHARGDDLGLAPVQGFAMMPEAFNRPVFATDKVRLVGDIVAAVVDVSSTFVFASSAVKMPVGCPEPEPVACAAASSRSRPSFISIWTSDARFSMSSNAW